MVVQYKLSIVVLLHYQYHSRIGDLLLFVLMRFVFFPSKKEAKEIVWGRCHIERTVLATEIEVMFGVGLDETQQTDQTQPSSPPIFVCKICETKLQNIAEIQNQVVQLKHKLQSYLASLHPCSPILHPFTL